MKYNREKSRKKSNRSQDREEFIKLQNEWYDKLAESGFSDLEWLDKNSGSGQSSPFLRHNSIKSRHLSGKDIQNRAEYFLGASQFAQDYKFPTILHKFVWRLYIEGISYRNMIPIIEKKNYKKYKTPSIFWLSIHKNKLK